MYHWPNLIAMKRLFAVLAILTGFFASAQLLDEVHHPDIAAKLFRNPKYVADQAQGSPYVQKMFMPAMVENLKVKANMRYNAYKDEFEFITPKGDTLVLDKIEDFSLINFAGSNNKYELTAYVLGKKLEYGYLANLYNRNSWTLYERQRITRTEAKVARNTMETSIPAKYNAVVSTYLYKKADATITEFPDSKKELIKAFPEKKEQLETFFKENKIDFENEADLKRLINLLAG